MLLRNNYRADNTQSTLIRIHRSTIVNVRHVRAVQPWFQGSYIVLLQSGEELRMSRYQRDAVDRLPGK
jgi:two-component system LytT family response regulator